MQREAHTAGQSDYIEQFEITNRAKKDVFDKEVTEEDRVFFDNYFRLLQDLINLYTKFDVVLVKIQ